MKTILFATFIGLLIFSCGKGIQEQKAGTSILIGEEMNLNSFFTSDHLNKARYLCDKLRSKRIKVMSQSTLNSYNVALSVQSCDGKSTNLSTIVKVSTSPNYLVTGENGIFNKSVETDLDGHFANVCSDIFAGLEPHLINYIGASEVVQIQVEGVDRFSIVYGKKNSQGIYITSDVEVYTFDLKSTDKFQAANIKFFKKGQCTDPNSSEDFYTKEQILE